MAHQDRSANEKNGDSESNKLSSFESCFPHRAFSTYNDILSRRILKPSESQQNIKKINKISEESHPVNSLSSPTQIENVPPPARKIGKQTSIALQTSPSPEHQPLRSVRKVHAEKLLVSFPSSGNLGSQVSTILTPDVSMKSLTSVRSNPTNSAHNAPLNSALTGSVKHCATNLARDSLNVDAPKRHRVYKKKTMNITSQHTPPPHLGQNVIILNRTIQRGNVLYTEVRTAVSSSAVPVSVVPVSVVSQSFSNRNRTSPQGKASPQGLMNVRPQAMGIATNEQWKLNFGNGDHPSSGNLLQLKELPHLSTEDVEDVCSAIGNSHLNYSYGNSL